jgi:hypothetical protein
MATIGTIPPAPVLAPAVPPLEEPSVVPMLSMTGTMATTTPAPVLATATGVPQLEDSSVAHVPSAGENEQRASKKGKMRPGSSLTARYGILTHTSMHYRLLALIHLFRNLCAQDWCVKYPDGTAAEFKQYYDELSNEDKKVRLIRSNVQIFKELKLIFLPSRSMNSDRKKQKRR